MSSLACVAIKQGACRRPPVYNELPSEKHPFVRKMIKLAVLCVVFGATVITAAPSITEGRLQSYYADNFNDDLINDRFFNHAAYFMGTVSLCLFLSRCRSRRPGIS